MGQNKLYTTPHRFLRKQTRQTFQPYQNTWPRKFFKQKLRTPPVGMSEITDVTDATNHARGGGSFRCGDSSLKIRCGEIELFDLFLSNS